MKNFAFALALAVGAAGSAIAAPLEIIAVSAAPAPAVRLAVADLRPSPAASVETPLARMSELPEPEVFLMMLLGLCLIGYRASRHSDEKFD